MSTMLKPVPQLPDLLNLSHVAVIIPTCNAGEDWFRLVSGLRLQGLPSNQILIVDSSSEDGTEELAESEGYRVVSIDRRDFNHGGTRQFATQHVPWATIVIYLTQDAVLANADSLHHLLSAFDDSRVAAAYGRQLPRLEAGPIEAHARIFNYPPIGDVRDFESRHTLGIKATFMSNSFSAYRVSSLREVGGFPSNVIMAEDAIVAGRLLLAGWRTVYVAEAKVYHSHPFTIAEEFRRYFDTGVYHRQEAWLRDRFGNPGGEGKRFVLSELAFLMPRHCYLVPYALVRTFSKALGYHLGLNEALLGKRWSKKLSYHREFWNDSRLIR